MPLDPHSAEGRVGSWENRSGESREEPWAHSQQSFISLKVITDKMGLVSALGKKCPRTEGGQHLQNQAIREHREGRARERGNEKAQQLWCVEGWQGAGCRSKWPTAPPTSQDVRASWHHICSQSKTRPLCYQLHTPIHLGSWKRWAW